MIGATARSESRSGADYASFVDVRLLTRASSAGLNGDEIVALVLMKPHKRYRLDAQSVSAHQVEHDAAQSLIGKGLAHDISSHFAGNIRGAMLSEAGQIVRALLVGRD